MKQALARPDGWYKNKIEAMQKRATIERNWQEKRELRDKYSSKQKLAYRRVVDRLTKQNLRKNPIIGIEKRGFDRFHVDHIVSIHDGFWNDIPAELIADVSNLRVIPAITNIIKRNNSMPKKLAELKEKAARMRGEQ